MFYSFSWSKRTYWRTPWIFKSRWWSLFFKAEEKTTKTKTTIAKKQKKVKRSYLAVQEIFIVIMTMNYLSLPLLITTLTDNSAITNTAILFGKCEKDNLKKEQIFNIWRKFWKKQRKRTINTVLGLKQRKWFTNREKRLDDKIVKLGNCSPRTFSTANPLDSK